MAESHRTDYTLTSQEDDEGQLHHQGTRPRRHSAAEAYLARSKAEDDAAAANARREETGAAQENHDTGHQTGYEEPKDPFQDITDTFSAYRQAAGTPEQEQLRDSIQAAWHSINTGADSYHTRQYAAHALADPALAHQDGTGPLDFLHQGYGHQEHTGVPAFDLKATTYRNNAIMLFREPPGAHQPGPRDPEHHHLTISRIDQALEASTRHMDHYADFHLAGQGAAETEVLSWSASREHNLAALRDLTGNFTNPSALLDYANTVRGSAVPLNGGLMADFARRDDESGLLYHTAVNAGHQLGQDRYIIEDLHNELKAMQHGGAVAAAKWEQALQTMLHMDYALGLQRHTAHMLDQELRHDFRQEHQGRTIGGRLSRLMGRQPEPYVQSTGEMTHYFPAQAPESQLDHPGRTSMNAYLTAHQPEPEPEPETRYADPASAKLLTEEHYHSADTRAIHHLELLTAAFRDEAAATALQDPDAVTSLWEAWSGYHGDQRADSPGGLEGFSNALAYSAGNRSLTDPLDLGPMEYATAYSDHAEHTGNPLLDHQISFYHRNRSSGMALIRMYGASPADQPEAYTLHLTRFQESLNAAEDLMERHARHAPENRAAGHIISWDKSAGENLALLEQATNGFTDIRAMDQLADGIRSAAYETRQAAQQHTHSPDNSHAYHLATMQNIALGDMVSTGSRLRDIGYHIERIQDEDPEEAAAQWRQAALLIAHMQYEQELQQQLHDELRAVSEAEERQRRHEKRENSALSRLTRLFGNRGQQTVPGGQEEQD